MPAVRLRSCIVMSFDPDFLAGALHSLRDTARGDVVRAPFARKDELAVSRGSHRPHERAPLLEGSRVRDGRCGFWHVLEGWSEPVMRHSGPNSDLRTAAISVRLRPVSIASFTIVTTGRGHGGIAIVQSLPKPADVVLAGDHVAGLIVVTVA